MRARILLLGLVLAPLFGIVPASADSLTNYDVRKAETWADALAICDVTKFLLSEPKLDSEVIIAPVPGGSEVALRRPLFLPPTNFYSEVMKETYEKVLQAGQVTGTAYAEARLRYAKLMLGAYHNTPEEKVFLADQMKTCYALAVDALGRARNTKDNSKH